MWLLDTDRFVHDANAAARAELLRGRLLVQRGAAPICWAPPACWT